MSDEKKPHGGKRAGSGRKLLPEPLRRKRRVFYVTDAEYEIVLKALPRLQK